MRHMPEIKRCEMCHPKGQKDKLVLLDGVRIEKERSAELCGQCHGPKYSEWRRRLHGKLDFTCVKCHEAHAPKFKAMKAMPPPKFPKLGVPKKEVNAYEER